MFWDFLVYFFIGFLVAQFASLLTTVYLHRGSTHRSVEFSPGIEIFMQFGLWLTTGINRLEWVAIHLCHHAHPDEKGDPHSPVTMGFWKVQLGNIFLYRKAAKNPEVLEYGKHIKLSFTEKTVFRSGTLGLVIGILTLWYGFGLIPTAIIVGTHMLFYIFIIPGFINGWCHMRGYKNFPNSPAFNNRFVAWFTAGEGLHNNHHHRPGNPSLRHTPSEVDLGWILIRLLSAFNLVRVTPST